MDGSAVRDTLEQLAAVRSALRVHDALLVMWHAAAEGLVLIPFEREIDELTSIWGIGEFCDPELLHAEGRWGHIHVVVGEYTMRLYMNPLERLLMCSNFVGVVALQVADTGPEMLFPPLIGAGLLPEPYVSMSVDEWAALRDGDVWQSVVVDLPPDRVWWEMVDHPYEQLLVWVRALASGLIDAPAALLYGASSLDDASRDSLSVALAEQPDLDRVLVAVENAFGQDATVGNTRAFGKELVQQYRQLVPASLVIGEEDAFEVVIHHPHFRDLFLKAMSQGRTGVERMASAYQRTAMALSTVASRLEEGLLCRSAAP